MRSALCVLVILAVAGSAIGAVDQVNLAHRYEFSGNANDSAGTANGTLIDTATYSSWGVDSTSSYLQLDNNWKPSNMSQGGAYVYVPPVLDALKNNNGVTIEMWFDVGDPMWFVGMFAFGNSQNNGPGADLLGVANFQWNDRPSNRMWWYQEAGGWQHDVWADGTLNDKMHLAVVVDNANGQMLLYNDGVQVAVANRPPWEMPGLSSGDNTYQDIDNGIGRWQGQTGDQMFNGRIYEFRIWKTALSGDDIAQTFAWGPDIVPEPVTATMLLLGSLLLVRRRRA